MQKKQAVFRVKGMSRDLAVSKFNPEMAYEIKNMRLLATDDSTTISLVNEKGTLDSGITIFANVIGIAAFSDKLVVFSHNSHQGDPNPDKISKIFFVGNTLTEQQLYSGNLDFSVSYPIETIPLYESENVQKVYWVDGKNQPRVINVESGDIQERGDSQFDFLPEVALNESILVDRVTDRGGMFPAGVLQYCITYSQKNGQESSVVWSSEPLYTVLDTRGGSANENTNAAYKLIIDDSDTNFDFINIYSIIKTSESGEFVVKRVNRVPTSSSLITIYDTNTTGETVDATSLLFKGGDKVIAGTMASKDNTLFLGDLKVSGNLSEEDYNIIKYQALTCSVEASDPRTYREGWRIGVYYDYTPISAERNSFKYLKKDNFYRVGIQLQDKYGKWSAPLFVDDIKATEAPYMDRYFMYLPTYKINIPQTAVREFQGEGFKKVRPVIVYPSAIKRTVIAQGTVCPTIASVRNRVTGGIWGQSSWFFRPFTTISSSSDPGDIGNISVESRNLHFLAGSNKYNAEIQSMESPLDYADGDLTGVINSHLDDYFIDSSLVTFHTPDIDKLSSSDLVGAQFRITGYFFLNSVSGRFNITTTNKKATSSAQSGNYVFLVSGDTPGTSLFKDTLLATRTLWKDTNYYLTYPWHRNGSLNADSRDSSPTDILETKVLANLRNSQYFKQLSNAWEIESSGITTPIICDGTKESLSIVDIPENISYVSSYAQSKLNYHGGIDEVITPTTPYSIYRADQLNDTPYATPLVTSVDPIPIRYASTKHIVFAFNNTPNHSQVVLPVPYGYSRYSPSERGIPFWLEQNSSLQEDKIAIETDALSGNEVMWIGELYRDIQDATEVFGDPNIDFELEQNQWQPAGQSVSIEDDAATTVYITEGDTFFDRWDCLKTYPISVDDPNQLVEILSFMCESYTNLEGRYDKNRGLIDNTYINNTNFNLFNPVYNDISNYFRFRTLDFQEDRESVFPSAITYSLTKTLGEEIDTWTNVNLASILNLDGDKGKVTAIRRYNNDLIAFQPKGISQILFNENVQIATTTGVPIEIANSGKVQGKRYISSEIGCLNKWSICQSLNGLYFADDYSRDFYLMNGNGINSLTDKLGFHSWIVNKFKNFDNKPWSFYSRNFTTHYDKVNNELLITSPDDSLAYSENLGQFSSFYDYGNVTFMGTLNEKNIMFKTSSDGGSTNLWIEHEGPYNTFFGNRKDYSVEVIVNQEPLTDKVFNNVEFRADDFNEQTGYLLDTTFDKLEVENEYQKGMEHLTFNRCIPSSLKKKFRIWRANIPRWNVAINGKQPNYRDRMRNPWLKVKLSKDAANYTDTSGLTKTVLHDIVVDYLA